MFGIGLPELILIMAVALIVVGPDKLPELAKSLAKGIVELKKAASSLKESLEEEDEKHPARDQVNGTENRDELLAAYKNLPEGVITDNFEPANPEGPEDASEPTPSTEEIEQTSPDEPEPELTDNKSDT